MNGCVQVSVLHSKGKGQVRTPLLAFYCGSVAVGCNLAPSRRLVPPLLACKHLLGRTCHPGTVIGPGNTDAVLGLIPQCSASPVGDTEMTLPSWPYGLCAGPPARSPLQLRGYSNEEEHLLEPGFLLRLAKAGACLEVWWWVLRKLFGFYRKSWCCHLLDV